jgi:hypothetical protein
MRRYSLSQYNTKLDNTFKRQLQKVWLKQYSTCFESEKPRVQSSVPPNKTTKNPANAAIAG